MQFLLFLLLYPLLWLISILPFPVLYLLSDGVCFLLYRVIGYRKKTVRGNLALALPHLSRQQQREVERKFYSHMCDIFLEMIKTMTISEKEMDKRFKFANMETYLEMEKKNKDIALMCGHYASYEWVVSMNKFITFEGFAIYKKISNKYFDKLVHSIRARFKAHLITTKETPSTLMHNHAIGKRGIYGFAADQSPKLAKAHHWVKFMGVETPVHTGAEMLAKKFDMNVIFLKTKKLKRGHYEATFVEMFDDPRAIPDYQITDHYITLLEAQIYDTPEFYLWTHKRWKYRR